MEYNYLEMYGKLANWTVRGRSISGQFHSGGDFVRARKEVPCGQDTHNLHSVYSYTYLLGPSWKPGATPKVVLVSD